MPTTTTDPIPSHQSAPEILGLQPKETWEPSRLIGQSWSEKIKEQSLFSARTTSRSYLDMVRKRLAEIASRQVIPLVAERQLRETLQNLGYRPETGFPDNDGRIPPATPGSITDLSSSRRIQLIVDTNVKQARSMAQLASSENPVFLMTNPAWKLTRTGARKRPRGDWRDRWIAAGNSVGWKGAAKSQMVALKTSPIWKAIGDGAGGFTDTIVSSFPPFAFGSGMAWVNVGRREWQRLCQAEGIDDGLTEITRRAKSAQERTTSASARPGASSAAPTATRAFQPSVARKDAAYENCRRAIADAQLAENEIQTGMARINRVKGEIDAAYDEADAFIASEFVEKTIKELDASKRQIAEARQRLTTYADGIAQEKLPRTSDEQTSFDRRMTSVDEASRKVRVIVAQSRKTAAQRITSAVKVCRGDLDSINSNN